VLITKAGRMALQVFVGPFDDASKLSRMAEKLQPKVLVPC